MDGHLGTTQAMLTRIEWTGGRDGWRNRLLAELQLIQTREANI